MSDANAKNNILFNVVLIAIGVVLSILSISISGSSSKDFISGILVGIGIGMVLIGAVFFTREMIILVRKKRG